MNLNNLQKFCHFRYEPLKDYVIKVHETPFQIMLLYVIDVLYKVLLPVHRFIAMDLDSDDSTSFMLFCSPRQFFAKSLKYFMYHTSQVKQKLLNACVYLKHQNACSGLSFWDH